MTAYFFDDAANRDPRCFTPLTAKRFSLPKRSDSPTGYGMHLPAILSNCMTAYTTVTLLANFVKNQLKACGLSASNKYSYWHLFVSKKVLDVSVCSAPASGVQMLAE